MQLRHIIRHPPRDQLIRHKRRFNDGCGALVETDGFAGCGLLDYFEVDGFGEPEGELGEYRGGDDVDALFEDEEGCYWGGLGFAGYDIRVCEGRRGGERGNE